MTKQYVYEALKSAKWLFNIFMFSSFFLDSLRSNFAIFLGGGPKNADFCRKEAKVDQRSTQSWSMLTFDLPKFAFFCRTEHVVAQRST